MTIYAQCISFYILSKQAKGDTTYSIAFTYAFKTDILKRDFTHFAVFLPHFP